MSLRYSIPLAAGIGFTVGVAGTLLLAVVPPMYSDRTICGVAVLAWRQRHPRRTP